MNKALVTGAAGFIGSHVARWLLKDGCEVVALDDLLPGRGIPVHAATDQQSDDLGFFQTALSGTPTRLPGNRLSKPAVRRLSTADRRQPPLTAQDRYVCAGREVPLNHGASDCSRRNMGGPELRANGTFLIRLRISIQIQS